MKNTTTSIGPSNDTITDTTIAISSSSSAPAAPSASSASAASHTIGDDGYHMKTTTTAANISNNDDTSSNGNNNENNTMLFPIPAKLRPKLTGWDFYRKILGSPKLVVAPMVDQSELAWRLLCRRHGAQLCYTPMFHSNIFIQDPKYRHQALLSCPEDRPLILQFCGNDPNILLEAALLAQDHCDAIDINLGCPQGIAKRGHYGAFLQDEWELLETIVSTLNKNVLVPITCKIRIFPDVNKTIKYAQMLERAGCQLLTVHGRTRDQKGPLTGLADWRYIKAVREKISIPMFSNGNINSMEDIDRCLLATGVEGVMTAEGNLHNPAMFDRMNPLTWDMAKEYLNIVDQYPCPTSYIRGHLFKIFHHLLNLPECADYREEMAVSHQVDEFRQVVLKLERKFLPYHLGDDFYQHESSFNLNLPPWICQPYIRMEPEEHKRVMAEKVAKATAPDRMEIKFFDDVGNQISRKLSKKLKRCIRKPNYVAGSLKLKRTLELCSSGKNDCVNPVGLKCVYKFCKVCCRDKCHSEDVDCVGHKLFSEKRRKKAEFLATTARAALIGGSANETDNDDNDDDDIATENIACNSGDLEMT